MKILVTGFSPFGGEKINPSYEAVKLLPDVISGCEIIKAELPTSFLRSETELNRLYNFYCPDAILSVGQAGGRKGISFEKIAINYRYASIPDNDGYKPLGEPVDSKSEFDGIFTNLDAEKTVDALRKNGITASVSYSAGSYVCNSVFYNALTLTKKYKGLYAGFIHVPFSPEQLAGKPDGTSFMTVEEIARSLEFIIKSIASDLNSEMSEKTQFNGCDRLILENVTDSTNNDAKEILKSGFDGTAAIISDKQTSGRGRLGRSFYSPDKKGLYLSCVFPFEAYDDIMLVTPFAAVAVCKSVEKLTFGAVKPGIKWVNDVYVNGKKACGILTEPVCGENGKIKCVIIGIGVNLTENDFPDELKNIAVSIGNIDRLALAKDIFEYICPRINKLKASDFIDEYRKDDKVATF